MTPQNWAKAIAIVESGDRSNPLMGDGGRARGRYQMHPDFYDEWKLNLNIHAQLGETWDSQDTRIAIAYFTFRTGQGLTAIQAAVSYHRGHIVREGDPDWLADDYAAKFADAARSIATT
jgi:hypothetical protein